MRVLRYRSDLMKYRRKSAPVALRQLNELANENGVYRFRMADYALPPEFFSDFLPALEQMQDRYYLHYEIRPNLTLDQCIQLKHAGVQSCQLGIESFSTSVLTRMRKGSTMLQNVFAIFTLNKLGVQVGYNIIYGFMGDTSAEYESMLSIVPSLSHLTPPMSYSRVLVTRYSDLAENPQSFGYPHPLSHDPRYEIIFSEEFRRSRRIDLDKLCYYFANYLLDSVAIGVDDLYVRLAAQLEHWRAIYANTRLYFAICGDGTIQFYDTRFNPGGSSLCWGPCHADVYKLLAGQVATQEAVLSSLASVHRTSDISRAIQELCEARLVLCESNSFLGIAFPAEVYQEDRLWWLNPESQEIQYLSALRH